MTLHKRIAGKLRLLIWLLAGFAVVSILGGSLVWNMLGLAPDLTIDGVARQVTAAPSAMGRGWGAYGGDSGGTRYSAANQITRTNVKDMRVAWQYRTGMPSAQEAKVWAFEATPILTGDALAFCTPFDTVVALDPGTGARLWVFDPRVARNRRPANQYVCRGLAQWRDPGRAQPTPCATRLYLATADARLISLDARSGEPCKDFGSEGVVSIDPGRRLDWPGEFQITSAPSVANGTVIVGSSIGDNRRVDAPRGVVRAFDARTGAPRWTFDPIGQGQSPTGAASAGSLAIDAGGANVWSTISVDEERGLVFLPTSSPSPDYYGGRRVGDNRWSDSVVAVDARSGRVVWAFQTVHHDVWDYDLASQPGLYPVWQAGRSHDVVAQVTKTGLVFVLDRDTGKPVLPVDEKPVPQGGVNGETLSPTQPLPRNTAPLVPSALDARQAFGITLWDRLACAAKIRRLKHAGLYTPPSIEGTLEYPFWGGGANWGGAAFDPTRNLMVVNLSNMGHVVTLVPRGSANDHESSYLHDAIYAPMTGTPYGVSRTFLASPLGLPCTPPPWGVLAGVDLVSGRIVWRRTFGTTEDLAPGGLALSLGTPNLGGPIVTAGGLVFVAATMDNYLRAFDVGDGSEIWKGRLPAGGQATPMTYMWRGRQYVVIVAGGYARANTKIGDYVIAYALK